METVTFSVEGTGEFEVLAENTLEINSRIDLRLQLNLGDDFLKTQENLSRLTGEIHERLLREHFAGRAAESLIAEERKHLNRLFADDASPEKSMYNQLVFSLYRNRFFIEFPLVCIRKPEGFDLDAVRDPALFDRIFAAFVTARSSVVEKKKD